MSRASNLAGFVTSIFPVNNLTVGVITATSFIGDGSGLTNVVGSGSGTIILDDGVTVGTAGTINFGANLSVSPISAGLVTVTGSSYVNTAGVSTYASTAGVATYASTAGISTTSQGLTGTPNLNVGVVTATSLNGSGAGVTSINASNITSGIVSTARLATSGTANSTTFLRGDQTWGAAGGGFGNAIAFTTPGSFSVPATTTKVKITATGGGQAGGGYPSVASGNAGGTGIAVINLSGGETLSVTIGSAGSPPGGSGGSTTVVNPTGPFTYVTAYGGNSPSDPAGIGATFTAPAPSYQTTLAVMGGRAHSVADSGPPTGGTTFYSYPGGSSYFAGANNSRSWGAGGGASGFYNTPLAVNNVVEYAAGPGVVIIEY